MNLPQSNLVILFLFRCKSIIQATSLMGKCPKTYIVTYDLRGGHALYLLRLQQFETELTGIIRIFGFIGGPLAIPLIKNTIVTPMFINTALVIVIVYCQSIGISGFCYEFPAPGQCNMKGILLQRNWPETGIPPHSIR